MTPDRRSRIAGEVVHHVVISGPLTIGRDLPENLIGDRTHRSDEFNFLFCDPGIIGHGTRHQTVRITNKYIAGLAVAFHSEFDAVLYTHLNDPVDHGNALAGHFIVARFRFQLVEDLAEHCLSLFLGFLIDLFDIFQRKPGIVGFAVGDLDMFSEEHYVFL